MEGRGLRHIPALDGLRGAAVAAVLLFHGGHLAGGYLGVDLFFVLSGYLITSLLFAEAGSHHQPRVRLGAFWARRARRLLPALGGLLVGVAVYAAVFARPDELAQIRGDALATVGYAANWRAVLAANDYWSLFSRPSPLQHTWSLAIEEQFYLLWPLVFVGLLAWRKRAVAPAVFATALLGAIASGVAMLVLFDPSSSARAYYGTDTRAAGILLGAALAAMLRWHGPVRGRAHRAVLEVAGVVAAGGLALAWIRLEGQSPVLYRGGLFVCGVAAVAVIAAAVHPEPGPIARILSWRPLCLLGLVSYGLYLWHWPVYVVLDAPRTGLSGWTLLGVRVAVTLVIAVGSYALIERPVRRGAGTPRVWRIAVPAFATAAAVALVVSTAGAERVRFAGTEPVADRIVEVRATPAPGLTRVLVTGDSVAMTLTPGLQHAAGAHRLEVVSGAAEACGPDGQRQLPVAQAGEWTEMTGGIGGAEKPCVSEDELVARFQPDVVLGIPSGIHSLDRGLDAFRDAKTFELLRRFPEGVVRIWTTIGCVGSPREVADPEFADRVVGANAILRDVAAQAPTPVRVVDLDGFVCPDGSYQSALGPVTELRPDGLHYGPAGSDLVGDWLAGEVARIARDEWTGGSGPASVLDVLRTRVLDTWRGW